MARITALDIADSLTGDEHLPIVQHGTTRRTTMAALREAITPFLQYWYKGDRGDPGGNLESVGPFAQLKLIRPDIPLGTDRITSAEGWEYLRVAEPGGFTSGNMAAAPLDFTDPAWTGAALVDGRTLIDSDATSRVSREQVLPGAPVGKATLRVAVLRDTVPRATRFVGLTIAFAGSNARTHRVFLDTATGEARDAAPVSPSSSAVDAVLVEEKDGYWVVSLTATALPSCTGWSIGVSPAMGNSDFTQISGAATGSATFGAVEALLGSPNIVDQWPEIGFIDARGDSWQLNTRGPVTPAQFGVVAGVAGNDVPRVTANTAALQRYCDFITRHNCPGQDASVPGTLWINRQIQWGSRFDEPATKVLRGRLSLRTETPMTSMVDFHWQRNVLCNLQLGLNGGGAAYATRGVLHGATFNNCRGMDWSGGNIAPSNFRFAGAAYAQGNNSFCKPRVHAAFYCGSGGNDAAANSVTATWTRNSHGGGDQSATQYSRINVSTQVPDDCWAMDGNVIAMIGGRPHLVTNRNKTNGTIDVFPWIADTVAEGTLWYIYGGALYLFGADTNALTVSVEAQLCGMALASGSLYGSTINLLSAQFCGVGHAAGLRQYGVHQGDQVLNAYYEGNRVDVSMANGQNGDVNAPQYLGMLESADPAKVWTYLPVRERTTGQQSSFDGPDGAILAIGRVRAEWEKRSPDAQRANTLELKINRRNIYIAETGVVSRSVQIQTLGAGVRRNLGYSGGRYEASGPGPNNAPTGTITFTAQGSSVLVNGQQNVSFSRFDGAAIFSFEWDPAMPGYRVSLLTGRQRDAVTVILDPVTVQPGATIALAPVMVADAMPGDFADVSYAGANGLRGVTVRGHVDVAGQVAMYLHNPTTAPVALAAGVLRVRLRKA